MLRSQTKDQEFVVQEYIEDPLLINGYGKEASISRTKFDCRVYVLLTGTRPLQAFVCKEGLARFCTV